MLSIRRNIFIGTIILVQCFWSTSCKTMNNLNSRSISHIISKQEQKLFHDKKYSFYSFYENMRSELDFMEKLKPNLANDTIYFLQDDDFGEGFTSLSLAFWNKSNLHCYIANESKDKNKPVFMYDELNFYSPKYPYTIFPEHMVRLVNTWNLNELRKESKMHGFVKNSSITAIRVIFCQSKVTIDFFRFSPFFDSNRDPVRLPDSELTSEPVTRSIIR